MLPKNSVAVVLDFGENIAVKYQNGIKSLHSIALSFWYTCMQSSSKSSKRYIYKYLAIKCTDMHAFYVFFKKIVVFYVNVFKTDYL